MNLTTRELEIVTEIDRYRHDHGYAPTMQELSDIFGVSKVTIFTHVNGLESKSVIRRNKHKARSIEIIDTSVLPEPEESTLLPLLGSIAARQPIDAVENRECLDLTEIFRAREGTYVLRVRGDSFASDYLFDGDYVVVSRNTRPCVSERVIAEMTNGTVRIGRYFRSGSKVWLESGDTSERVYFGSECDLKIVGVVIGMLRSAA